ncbi:MAG: glycerol-3-phosphate 1-O-acyltransferase PlsY [Alcanivoracaceae bacterium]|nr:glycerol-3-phosphate 1-O-acyltransferase PlsY [Alcanivoracaceae bacterium]
MDLSPLQDNALTTALLFAAAYLGGSISSAILVCRLFGLPDPRTEGSQNPGATNVMRLGGKPAAALTLLGDVLKGVIPVLVAHYLSLGPLIAALAGFFAFLGHLLPVFFQFRGGKGVATAFGLLFALQWAIGLATGVIWVTVFVATRISSLASMLSFIAMPVFVWLWLPAALPALLLMTIVLLGRHHSNIRKLLTGEELGFKKKK